MTYADARALLDRLPKFEVKPGLERIDRLLGTVGLPQKAFPAIHVAGTNGKGSVVAMLDAVLRAAGYRVGRYTSPEVVDFRDRITIDGRWLSEHEWAAGVGRLAPAIESAEDPPAQFEAITALAFDAFSQAGVDVAVVEVGLGGRFDATRVVQPVLTILTNVSLDHTAILGTTETEIACEKVGIAREGVPFLTGALTASVARIADEECQRVGTERVRGDRLSLNVVGHEADCVLYQVKADDLPGRLGLRLRGDYQKANLALVLDAIRLLRRAGFRIPDAAILEGLSAVEWPGRFEIVRREPTILLDGAHNVAGAKALAAGIERMAFSRSKRHLILGILRDKDIDGMVACFAPVFGEIIATSSMSPRALPAEALADVVRPLGTPTSWYDSIEDALQDRLPAAEGDELWVIGGSLTVVGEARRILERLG